MALLSAFLLFILLSLLPFLLLFGNSISYLKVENSSEKISKKKYQKNNSNLHSAVCHLSQLKFKKKKNSFKNNNKKPKNQKNFSVFLISHISLANNYQDQNKRARSVTVGCRNKQCIAQNSQHNQDRDIWCFVLSAIFCNTTAYIMECHPRYMSFHQLLTMPGLSFFANC